MISFSSVSKFFLYASIFFVAIVTTATLFPFIVGKYMWFRTSVDLAWIFFLIALIWDPQGPAMRARLKQVFSSPLTWAISAFTVAFLLACLFGVNPSFSFWSNFERGEGGLQMIHLYLLFVLLATMFKEEKNWRLMFYLGLIAAGLMIFYGIGAGSGWPGFVGAKFSDPGFRFQGSIGNPAYVATYLIFTLFYALYILFDKYRRKMFSAGGITIFFAILVSLVFFYLAATRGALIGLVFGVLAFIAYLILAGSRFRKQILTAGAVLILLLILVTAVHNQPVFQKIPGIRIFDLSFTAKTFTDRAIMWKTAWDGFKARPAFGWGPENFLTIFDTHFNIAYFQPAAGFGAWFDRAHSLIFDYLAETGLVGFLAFVSIFVAFFYEFLRLNKKKENSWADSNILKGLILALPVAYLIQGLVLFDVLPTYYNLFMFLAFSAAVFISKEKTALNK